MGRGRFGEETGDVPAGEGDGHGEVVVGSGARGAVGGVAGAGCEADAEVAQFLLEGGGEREAAGDAEAFLFEEAGKLADQIFLGDAVAPGGAGGPAAAAGDHDGDQVRDGVLEEFANDIAEAGGVDDEGDRGAEGRGAEFGGDTAGEAAIGRAEGEAGQAADAEVPAGEGAEADRIEASTEAAVLEDGEGGVVLALAEVEAGDEGRGREIHRGSASSVRRWSRARGGKSPAARGTNSQRYSWRNHQSERARRSSSRKEAGMRGH